MPSPSSDPLRAYRAYLAYLKRPECAGLPAPCHAPGEPRCADCWLSSDAKPASLELGSLADLLTTRTVTVVAGLAFCASLLDTDPHKYKGTGDSYCSKCGMAQAHRIHRDGPGWDARRARFGFGPMASPLHDANERRRLRVVDEAEVHRPQE